MQNISERLNVIADLADKNSDLSRMQQTISAVRYLIKGAIYELPLLKELDTELSIWQSKLAVILNEPAGRKGMAKHARFWSEKLREIHV